MIHLRPRSARRGITLLEVLTAIFIMGIGLLAILTLFPLGALSMARAVRDDRAAAAGANASALATAFDLRNDQLVAPLLNWTPPGFAAAPPEGPGYPVLVDPVYYSLGPAVPQPVLGNVTVGTVQSPGIPRISPAYITNTQELNRWFTFNDEVEFLRNGQPLNAPTSVRRPGTYTWTYLLRRSRPASPVLTELSVIVYSNRASDQITGETTFHNSGTVIGAKGTNVITVSFPADKPNIRKGAWILDTSYRAFGGGGTVNGYFYQVANVLDITATSMVLELEVPLKEDITAVVLMENVITVLERGTNWRP